jgi:integrase
MTTIGGQRYDLGVSGPDTPEKRSEAEDRLRALIDERVRAAVPPPPVILAQITAPAVPTVRTAAAAHLQQLDRRAERGAIQADSVKDVRKAYTPLLAEFGDRPVTGVTAQDLEEWADRPGWSPSTRRNYLDVVCALFARNGVKLKPERPPSESRGGAVCLTDSQFAAVLADIKGRYPPDLGAVLRVLRACGARPGEVCGLEADGVDWAARCTVKRKHKTKKRTGRDRIVYFNSDAMAVLEAQRVLHPTGPLFRTRAGAALTPQAVRVKLWKSAQRLGFRVIAYGMRHSFATRALTAGIPDTVVAGLLGHSGTTMVHKHYAHLGENSRLMHDAAEKLARGVAG